MNPGKNYCGTVLFYGEKKNVEKIFWTVTREFYVEKFRTFILPVVKIEGEPFAYFVEILFQEILSSNEKAKKFKSEKENWEYIIRKGWIKNSARPHGFFRKEFRTKISKEWADLWEDYEEAVKYKEKYERELEEYRSWDAFKQEMFDYNIPEEHIAQCKNVWDFYGKDTFFMNWNGKVIYNIADNGIWYDIYTDEIVRRKEPQMWECKKCGEKFAPKECGKTTYGAGHKVFHYCKKCCEDAK